jgi:hypothetical protein
VLARACAAAPIEFVQQLPVQGNLGAASGQGFYNWEGVDPGLGRIVALHHRASIFGAFVFLK